MSYVSDLFSQQLDHRRIEGDAENNAIVDAWVGALSDVFERLGLIAFGDEATGVEGARVLHDVRVAPLWALAHAAMYVGAQLPPRHADEADADYLERARVEVSSPRSIRRGTHGAIRRAIEPLLTGTKTIVIEDDFGGPYDLFVRTLSGETPDPAAVELRLEGDYVSSGEPSAIRAELRLVYVVADEPTWAEGERVWNAVDPAVTWDNVTGGDLD